MANEISAAAPSGAVCYAVLRDHQAWPWNTQSAALESYSEAHWAFYALTLTEQGTSGIYVGSFPGALPGGLYSVDVRRQLGSAPLPTDTQSGGGSFVWTGSSEAFVQSDGSGRVRLDTTQAVPASNSPQSVGDALNAARAQGFGRWAISGSTLTLYAADGLTAVRTFTLDSTTAPTQRS